MSPQLVAQEERILVPSNVLFCGTHTGTDLPERVLRQLRKEFRLLDDRLLQNFSDQATKHLIPWYIPEDQKVFSYVSRAGGDPNRSRKAKDLFRDTDFNGVPLWKHPLSQAQKSRLIKNFYDTYHEGIREIIKIALDRHPRGKVIFFDIHDTGNCMMRPDPREDTQRAKPFPELCLSYRDGKTCDPEIFHTFADLLGKYMNITPQIDDPYKGGHVIQRYSEQYNARLPEDERFHLNGIQIEVGRFLYMDEKTQTIKPQEVQWIRQALVRAIAELGVLYADSDLPLCA